MILPLGDTCIPGYRAMRPSYLTKICDWTFFPGPAARPSGPPRVVIPDGPMVLEEDFVDLIGSDKDLRNLG